MLICYGICAMMGRCKCMEKVQIATPLRGFPAKTSGDSAMTESEEV